MWKMMIIDDEYFVRMGIRETIDWAVHGVEIVGEAGQWHGRGWSLPAG